MDKKAIVIGAGPLGISIGTELLNAGYKVTFIEKKSTFLGLADTFEYNGLEFDKFYHFFYINDSQYAEDWLARYSNGKVEIRWQDISTDAYVDGINYNLDSIFGILKLVKFDIFKIVFTMLQIKLFSLNSKLDNISAERWSKDRFGNKFANHIWIPLLKQKFGTKYKEISAYWLATRIKRHMSTKNNRTGKSRFGYLIDTYKPYVDNFKQELVEKGGEILVNTRIEEVEIRNNRISKFITNHKTIDVTDYTIFSAISLAEVAKIKGLDIKLSYLNNFQNIGAVTLILFLDIKLSNHYWTTVTDDSIPFFAILQQNRLYPKNNMETVYLSQYCEQNHNLLSETDEDIYKEWFKGLVKIYPFLSENNVIDFKVFKSNVAAPIPFTGIMNKLPNFKSSIDNFYHAGHEHILPEDRGVGNSIRIGKILVKEFLCKIK